MSDLSVNTAPESVVSSSRKATAQTEVKTATETNANVSTRTPSSADVTNFVTSPKGVVDPQSGMYVLQYRDGETGEVEMQYPSKKAVAAYQRGEGAGAPTSTEQAGSSVPQNSGGESTGSGAEVSSVSTTTTTTASATGGTASGTGTGSTATDVDV